MQTADIAKSTQCWYERIWAINLARSAPARAVFRPLCSVFRTTHALLTCSAKHKSDRRRIVDTVLRGRAIPVLTAS